MLAGDGGRDALIYGTFGQGMCCTDGEWTLILPPDRELPLFAYSTMVPATIAPGDHSGRARALHPRRRAAAMENPGIAGRVPAIAALSTANLYSITAAAIRSRSAT